MPRRVHHGLVLFGFLLVAIATMSTTSPPAAAVVVKVPLIQFNIAGGNSTPTQITNTRNILTYATNANAPYFVSINEACLSDFYYFAGNHTPGHGGGMVATRNVEPDCNYSAYGNALLFAGDFMKMQGLSLPNGDRDCNDEEVECRSAICLKTNTFLGQMTTCGSHMISTDPALAGDQAAAFRTKSIAWAPYSLRFLMGDFNLQRTDPDFPAAYNTSDDIGYIGLTWSSRAASRTKQIDFIYWVNANVTWGDQARSCTANSDHCLIQTSAWITV